MSLAGKTVFITGASRGIGLAIALRAARDGANVVIAAKTREPHATLSGTIYTAAAAVEAAGGRALPITMDLRSEDQIEAAVTKTVDTFGGIDILVNNAGALSRRPTMDTSPKEFDLLHQVNVRGMYLAVRAAVPHLQKAVNPHVLTIAPLLMIEAPNRYAAAPAFMLAKLSMSVLTSAFAEEFAPIGIAFNALWPRVSIWTDGNRVQHGESNRARAHKPEIMADAAWHILNQDARGFSGRFTLAEDVLRDAGVVDFRPYYARGADPAVMFKSIQISHGLASI